MTVTRVTYSDLIMSFTLGTSTNPSSTSATNLILSLYKQAYIIMQGDLTNYSVTDANLSDAIMNGVFAVIQSAASRILEEWSAALKLNTQAHMPTFSFNAEETNRIGTCYGLRMRFPSREDDDLLETGDSVD